MGTDSSFSRLTLAWQAAGRTDVVALAAQSLKVLARRTGLMAPDRGAVLWLRTGDSRAAPPAAVTSLADGKHNYRITCVAPSPALEPEALLREHAPRLLVADVRWCEAVGVQAIRRAHRHAPQVDWLLCWDEPSPRWLDVLIGSGARGAVDSAADPTELARAFDAVLAGEVWLPRRVLQWLYASITDVHGSSPDTAPPSTTAAPSSAWPSGDSTLTHREAEVVSLLRQGLTNREIGLRLGVSINTVKKHVASAYEKRGIRSRRQTLG